MRQCHWSNTKQLKENSHFVAEKGASLGSLCGTLTDRADHDLLDEVLSSQHCSRQGHMTSGKVQPQGRSRKEVGADVRTSQSEPSVT